MRKTLFVISGPSGSGKSTIAECLCDTMPRIVTRVITVTTRKKRCGEINGVHYQFVSEKTFKKLIGQNRFLEFAEVYENFYGTLREDVDTAFVHFPAPLLLLDIQGATTMARKFPETVVIGILSKSDGTYRRLRRRNGEPADLAIRTNNFPSEELIIKRISSSIVYNFDGELSRAVKEVEHLIVKHLI